jgi:DNA-directed RNA polymerase specialized sigma24 family protein
MVAHHSQECLPCGVCRRGRRETPTDLADCEHLSNQSFWLQPQAPPDSELLDRQEGAAIRQLVASLPAHFREAIVLREFNDMTYREIAEVAGVPLGTVMSRLARARAMLLSAWRAREGPAQKQSARLPRREPEVSSGILANCRSNAPP